MQAPALLPDKRSIAVLPFLNMSSDPEQEYFSDGMTEDLITELSRLKGLFVIARNSVYTFKGRAVKTDQVSRELYRVPKSVTLGHSPTWASQIQDDEPRRFVMSAPIPLRQDFEASQLRGLAKKSKDGPQARRLLALAAIYDGATRTEAAKIGGVGLQIIRDWVLRFNARGPDALVNGKSPGQPSKLNDLQRQAIADMIERGPIPAVHGVVRWRLIDLAQWIFEEFRITIAKQTLSRELRAMGYRKLSARPRHHAQAQGAIEDFKKASQGAWKKSRAQRRSIATR